MPCPLICWIESFSNLRNSNWPRATSKQNSIWLWATATRALVRNSLLSVNECSALRSQWVDSVERVMSPAQKNRELDLSAFPPGAVTEYSTLVCLGCIL